MAHKYALALASICALLSGCASAPPQNGVPMAWDGHNDDLPEATHLHPKTALSSRPDPEANREAVLATLKPYSAEWRALHDQIEAEREKRLNAQLRICNGC